MPPDASQLFKFPAHVQSVSNVQDLYCEIPGYMGKIPLKMSLNNSHCLFYKWMGRDKNRTGLDS